MNETVSLIGRDYFTDHTLLPDPHLFYEELRACGPVTVMGDPPIAYVTGFDEAAEVLNDASRFSSLPSATGPKTLLPFEPRGDDITEQIAASRDPNSAFSLLVTYDGKQHLDNRAIISRLFTPLRLKASDVFMRRYAVAAVREVVAEGGCELYHQVALPYVTYVIADLLGVPQEDRIKIKDFLSEVPPAGSLENPLGDKPPAALQFMFDFFWAYLCERRENPRNDVLSEMALARYPDGGEPSILELVKLAMFLFSSGQDTSALLLGNCLRHLCEDGELQSALRADNTLIPNFIEEMMRLVGSLKMTSRLTTKTTEVGGVTLRAGTQVAVILAAANRDDRQWAQPNAVDLNRPKLKQQLGFSRGPHTCIGAPLARAEVRFMLEEFLNQTSSIALDEEQHGRPPDQRFQYTPSFMNHGVKKLHLRLTAAPPGETRRVAR